MFFGFGRRKGDTSVRRKRRADVTPRQAIPGLRILEKLGSGATCTVFKAQHVPSGEPVALKILSPKAALDPAAVQRFLAEARLLCGFDHPHLVRGFGCGQAKGLVHLVMELVKGGSVQAMMDQWGGALDTRIALDVVAQVASALGYLHEQGIVHRDVKPGNILVTAKGRAKLCDLGLALRVDPTLGSGAFGPVTAGTPEYMSPEQARGKLKLDVRSDLYALGATLYHMVTGEAPRNDAGDPGVRRRAVLEGIDRQGRRSIALDGATRHFILRLMEEEPAKRFGSATELISDVRGHLDGTRTFA